MMFDLSGMTALVTGASGGLGSAIAKALAGQGARLAVSGSNVDKLEKFRGTLGGDHVALPCNLSDGAAVDQLVPQAVEALGKTELAAPAVPLYANVTAAPVVNPDVIREQLVSQVTGMVRWRESIASMAASGVEEFVELGGKVLGPMVKRIAPEAKVTSVVTIEDIEALAKEIA